MAILVVRTRVGDHARELGESPVQVGRTDGDLIVPADLDLSRAHCVFERRSEGWRIRDLGSRNGTKLNGRRIFAEPLRDGDIVTCGQQVFEFLARTHASTGADLHGAASSLPGAQAPTATWLQWLQRHPILTVVGSTTLIMIPVGVLLMSFARMEGVVAESVFDVVVVQKTPAITTTAATPEPADVAMQPIPQVGVAPVFDVEGETKTVDVNSDIVDALAEEDTPEQLIAALNDAEATDPAGAILLRYALTDRSTPLGAMIAEDARAMETAIVALRSALRQRFPTMSLAQCEAPGAPYQTGARLDELTDDAWKWQTPSGCAFLIRSDAGWRIDPFEMGMRNFTTLETTKAFRELEEQYESRGHHAIKAAVVYFGEISIQVGKGKYPSPREVWREVQRSTVTKDAENSSGCMIRGCVNARVTLAWYPQAREG